MPNTTEEQRLIAEGFRSFAATLASHKAALERLNENQAAQRSKLVEFAEMLNEHSKLLEDIQATWAKNFDALGALVNQQTRVLEALRAVVLPEAVN